MDDNETAASRCAPGCAEQHTYISGLRELAVATTNMTGLIGPWGIPARTPEQQQADRDRWTAAEEREHRDVAVGYAVRALTPVAGAYDLPGFLGTGRADYGDAIISLAGQLGDYIRDGNRT